MLNLLPWWRRRCSGESNAATCSTYRCSARSWGTTTSATLSSSPCETIRGGILIPSHAPWWRLWSLSSPPQAARIFWSSPTYLLRRSSSPLCRFSSHHTKPDSAPRGLPTTGSIGLERLYFSSLSSSMVCTVFLGEPKTEEYRPRRPESYSPLVLLPRAFTGTTTSLMKIL